jgi:catechol 2,3-dioxygenase-like lactoylglutathione lyase family enzyme
MERACIFIDNHVLYIHERLDAPLIQPFVLFIDYPAKRREFCFSQGESMEIRFAVVSLWAEDVTATTHFYWDVVGLPLLAHQPGDRPHFDLGGTYLTIVHGQPTLSSNPKQRFPVVALSFPNLDAAVEKLQSHGVDLPWGVETNATGRWVMFHDPVGNLIELVEALEQR